MTFHAFLPVVNSVFLVKKGTAIVSDLSILPNFYIENKKIFSGNSPVGRAPHPENPPMLWQEKNPAKAETQIFWFFVEAAY